MAIDLALQISGGWRVGQTRRWRRVRLHGLGVARCELDSEGVFSPTHGSRGIDPLAAPAGRIRFTVDVPGRLVVECSSLEVEDLANEEEVVAPWEREREAFLDLSGPPPPSTEISARCFAQSKVVVVWRILGGEACAARDVPTSGYDGWFLQTPDRIARVNGGVMLMIAPKGEHTGIRLTNWDQQNPRLWGAVLLAFASFSVVGASCGNRVLDAAGFRELAQRRYAPVDR